MYLFIYIYIYWQVYDEDSIYFVNDYRTDSFLYSYD